MKQLFIGLAMVLLFTGVSASPAVDPVPGMWYNPDRSGHGLDISFYESDEGEVVGVVWYTYRQDGTPVWYLGAKRLSADRVENMLLYEYTWDGSRATAREAGELDLLFVDPTHARLDWVFSSGSALDIGTENIELLVAEPDLPASNHSGHWFNPDEPGWGMTVGNQGPVEFVVLYFYDGDGRATWALGAAEWSPGEVEYRMLSYRGACPGCTHAPPSYHEVGRLWRNFADQTHGQVAFDLQLLEGLSGRFSRNAEIRMLSKPVTMEQQVAVRMEANWYLVQTHEMLLDMHSRIQYFDLLPVSDTACPAVTTSTDGLIKELDWGVGCTMPDGRWAQGKLVIDKADLADTDLYRRGSITYRWQGFFMGAYLAYDGMVTVLYDVEKSGGRYTGIMDYRFDDLRVNTGPRYHGWIYSDVNGYSPLTLDFERLSYFFYSAVVGGFQAAGSMNLEMLPPQDGEWQRLHYSVDVESVAGRMVGGVEVRFLDDISLYFSPDQREGDTFVIDELNFSTTSCMLMPWSGSMIRHEGSRRYQGWFDPACGETVVSEL